MHALKHSCLSLLPLLIGVFSPAIAENQAKTDVLAVLDEAMEMISSENWVGYSDLMIEDGMVYVGISENGQYEVQSRNHKETRETIIDADHIERAWNPTVLVSDTIAVIWHPYDFYIDGVLSHCGIDIWNMIRTNEGGRISSLLYNRQQPPECELHPNGPP